MTRQPISAIAQETGVSIRTLYRVMNNNGVVNSRTRRKIADALTRHGYSCAGEAETTTRKKTVIFDIIPSPFIERVGISLMKRVSEHGCHCLIHNHLENKDRFLAAAASVDAIVMCSLPTPELIEEIRAVNAECLVINILGGGGGDIAVDSDDTLGGQLAARHLHAHGHRHVGVFTALDQPNHEARYKGFLAEMLYLDPGARVELHKFVPGRDDPPDYWTRYFDSRPELPTAMFIPIGGIADILPYCAERHGLSIPRDFSLVGYNRPSERTGVAVARPTDAVVFEIEQLVAWSGEYLERFTRREILPLGPIRALVPPRLECHGSVGTLDP